MKKIILKTFLLVFLLGCTSPKLSTLHREEVIKVPLQVLLKNKANYHSHFIETEGVFFRMFEWSAIHYPFKGDTIIRGEAIKGTGEYDGMLALWDGIWIDEHPRYKVNDKLHLKQVKVRGYFDTTRKGHFAGFSATLGNTYFIEPVESLLTTPASMQRGLEE